VGNDGAGRGDESDRMTKCRSRGDVIAKVAAIVGAIGQVERLCETLQVQAIAELDILREPGVDLKEWSRRSGSYFAIVHPSVTPFNP
jgi:selenophosphate synthetase-related protein